jgi:hypothetical protein
MLEAEKDARKHEQERETARLRALQERAMDRRGEIDELRAKRYQEAKDRAWRQNQMAIAEKRETMKRDISEARERQRSEKANRMAEQAQQEREEYQRVLDWSKTQNQVCCLFLVPRETHMLTSHFPG